MLFLLNCVFHLFLRWFYSPQDFVADFWDQNILSWLIMYRSNLKEDEFVKLSKEMNKDSELKDDFDLLKTYIEGNNATEGSFL